METPSIRSLRLLTALVLAWLAGACGGLSVRPVHSSVQKPSNVAVYVVVEDGGEPVTGLMANNFRIEEDGVALSANETRLTLLDASSVALHHTVVLVDLGGDLDPKRRELTARGVSHLVEKLRPLEGVTVFGFDGAPRLHLLGEFARSAGAGKPDLRAIERFRARDESRNLNGAVIEGLRQLDARLMRRGRPVRIGTLVVFTHGDDLAGRVSAADLHTALDETPHQLFALGIENQEGKQLEVIGRHGVQKSQDALSVPIAFEELSSKLKRVASKYYLVQYCSPSRTGVRQVRFTVEHEDREGTTSSGAVDLEFDAAGFSGGCNPKATPSFVTALSKPGDLEARRDVQKRPPAKTNSSPAPAPSDAAPSDAAPADAVPADGDPPQDGSAQDGSTQKIVPPPSSENYAD